MDPSGQVVVGDRHHGRGLVLLMWGVARRSGRRGDDGRRLPQVGPAAGVEFDDVGDPCVLYVPPAGGQPGEHVLFWTTDWDSNVPTAISTDLYRWTRAADSLPVLPRWALPSITLTWAPAAQAVARTVRPYFSTEDAPLQVERIGAAFSCRATGPYTDRSSTPWSANRTRGARSMGSDMTFGGWPAEALELAPAFRP